MSNNTKKITTTAMLAAIAYVVVVVGRIPVVLFLKYDPKDIIITLGGLIWGPLTSFIVSVIVSLIEMVTISENGILGCIMNIVSSCSFACTVVVKASRFLLKDDLEQTLQECMDDILREIRQEERVVEFGFVEGNMRLKADDIIYIETSKHKNVFYTKNQTFSIYKKMDDLEEDLKGMGFVRIHQSFLINMKYIERISSYVMILTTGKEISVPKSR